MKRKVIINLVGILLAFLLGALVMVLQGYNPLETYYRLFEYSLATSSKLIIHHHQICTFRPDWTFRVSCVRFRTY